jgi:hypothetical protein
MDGAHPPQVTWGVRFDTAAEASKFVGELATEVSGRMHKLGVRGRSVQLKLMRAVANAPENLRKGSVGHGVCDTYTRTVTLASFTRDAADIRCAAPYRASPSESYPWVPESARMASVCSGDANLQR